MKTLDLLTRLYLSPATMSHDSRAEIAQGLVQASVPPNEVQLQDNELSNWELADSYWALMDYRSIDYDDDYVAGDALDAILEDVLAALQDRASERMSLTAADCHEGLWVLLANGWIVGPLLSGAHGNDIFVEFEGRPWRVYLPEDEFHRSRRILAVGTRDELLKHLDTK